MLETFLDRIDQDEALPIASPGQLRSCSPSISNASPGQLYSPGQTVIEDKDETEATAILHWKTGSADRNHLRASPSRRNANHRSQISISSVRYLSVHCSF